MNAKGKRLVRLIAWGIVVAAAVTILYSSVKNSEWYKNKFETETVDTAYFQTI